MSAESLVAHRRRLRARRAIGTLRDRVLALVGALATVAVLAFALGGVGL